MDREVSHCVNSCEQGMPELARKEVLRMKLIKKGRLNYITRWIIMCLWSTNDSLSVMKTVLFGPRILGPSQNTRSIGCVPIVRRTAFNMPLLPEELLI